MMSLMGRIDLKRIDTTPGSGHWAAPPHPVEDYTAWLRSRYRTSRDASQCLVVTARSVALHGMAVEYDGPYAVEARKAVRSLARRIS